MPKNIILPSELTIQQLLTNFAKGIQLIQQNKLTLGTFTGGNKSLRERTLLSQLKQFKTFDDEKLFENAEIQDGFFINNDVTTIERVFSLEDKEKANLIGAVHVSIYPHERMVVIKALHVCESEKSNDYHTILLQTAMLVGLLYEDKVVLQPKEGEQDKYIEHGFFLYRRMVQHCRDALLQAQNNNDIQDEKYSNYIKILENLLATDKIKLCFYSCFDEALSINYIFDNFYQYYFDPNFTPALEFFSSEKMHPSAGKNLACLKKQISRYNPDFDFDSYWRNSIVAMEQPSFQMNNNQINNNISDNIINNNNKRMREVNNNLICNDEPLHKKSEMDEFLEFLCSEDNTQQSEQPENQFDFQDRNLLFNNAPPSREPKQKSKIDFNLSSPTL